MKTGVLAAIFCVLAPGFAMAGPIDRACVQSNRTANPMLCACIQRVANLTLTRPDQRLAAKFFTDPGKAQQIRTSGRNTDQKFWERYSNFGTTAEAVCSSG